MATSDPTFRSLRLDDRLLSGISDVLQYDAPTAVQKLAIPEALQGKDILCKAKTGSGKTVAYLVPVLQSIICKKDDLIQSGREVPAAIRALVLVPTRELCQQVGEVVTKLVTHCRQLVSVLHLGGDTSADTQRARLAECPDIVISTPSRICAPLRDGTVELSELSMLVIDEADIILSYGYDDDLRFIQGRIPSTRQVLMMSATLSPEVENLKRLVMLHNPAVLRVGDEVSAKTTLQQYFVHTPDTDKYLLVYALLRLKLIRGKVLLFVNTVERCYRLKLLLERLSLKAAVVNCELPVASRFHIVQEFNKGVFDYIIATDEAEKEVPDEVAGESDADEDDEPPAKRAREAGSGPKSAAKDDEYGVSRGIDFKNVDTVINFDFPLTTRTYIHRIGRTARAGSRGTALSLVAPGGADDAVLRALEDTATTEGAVKLQPFKFKMKAIEPFRYRVEDVLRGITKNAVRQARIAEIRTELLNSERLKAHFEDNPHDLDALRHDVSLLPAQVPRHLKRLPKYLVPATLTNALRQQATVAGTDARSKKRTKKRTKKDDPLKSFTTSKKRKHADASS